MKKMKQIMMILFTLLLNYKVYAVDVFEKDFNEEDIEYFLSTVREFEEECLDKDGSLKQKVYVEGGVRSCSLDAEYIQKEYEYLSEYLESNPEAYNHFLSCQNQKKSEKSLEDLTKSALEVSQKVSCTEDEKLKQKEKCYESFQCNNLRSIQAIKPVMPFYIRYGVDRFINNKVEEKGYDASTCLDESRSDCFTELWTSFASNIVATGKSLWELIKKGGESLWNLTEYFSKKSDDMHTAMVQKEKDVTRFIDDPIGWLSGFMDKIKYSIQSWMKTSVFCQKWADVPHMSKCVEPLEDLECLDCGTVANATCATMGVMVSELGMAALTAGVGNLASAGIKIAPKAMKVMTNKALKKVTRVAPELGLAAKKAKERSKSLKGMKSIKSIKSMQATAKASKMAQATAAAIKAAKAAKAVGSENVKRVLASIEKVQTKVMENKIVKKAVEIQDKVNITGKLADKAAEKGLKISDKLLSHTADKANINATRLTTNIRRTTRIVRARKGFDKAASATGSNSHVSHATNTHNTGAHTPAGDHVTNHGHVKAESHHSTTSEHKVEKPAKQDSVAKSEGQSNKGKESDFQQQQKERKNERVANNEQQKKQNKKEEHKKDEHADSENKKNQKLAKVVDKENLMKGFIANATARTVNEATNRRKSRDQRARNNSRKQNSFSRLNNSQRSVAAAKQALGAKAGQTRSQAIAHGEMKKRMYAQKNKTQFVRNMVASNPGMSKRKASRVFDQRKRDISEALAYLKSSKGGKKVASFKENISKHIDSIKALRTKKNTNVSKNIEKVNEVEIAKAATQRQVAPNTLTDFSERPTSRSSAPSYSNSVRNSFATGTATSAVAAVATSTGVSGGENSSNNETAFTKEASQVENSELKTVDSKENVATTSEGEGISNQELAEEDALKEKEELKDKVERKVATRKLASILDLLDENVEVEENAPFIFSMNQVRASSAEALKKLKKLEDYLDKNPASLGRKTTIKTKEYQIHTYEFEEGDEYTLKVKDGKVEILDKNKAKMLKSEAKKAREVPVTTMTSEKR